MGAAGGKATRSRRRPLRPRPAPTGVLASRRRLRRGFDLGLPRERPAAPLQADGHRPAPGPVGGVGVPVVGTAHVLPRRRLAGGNVQRERRLGRVRDARPRFTAATNLPSASPTFSTVRVAVTVSSSSIASGASDPHSSKSVGGCDGRSTARSSSAHSPPGHVIVAPPASRGFGTSNATHPAAAPSWPYAPSWFRSRSPVPPTSPSLDRQGRVRRSVPGRVVGRRFVRGRVDTPSDPVEASCGRGEPGGDRTEQASFTVGRTTLSDTCLEENQTAVRVIRTGPGQRGRRPRNRSSRVLHARGDPLHPPPFLGRGSLEKLGQKPLTPCSSSLRRSLSPSAEGSAPPPRSGGSGPAGGFEAG